MAREASHIRVPVRGDQLLGCRQPGQAEASADGPQQADNLSRSPRQRQNRVHCQPRRLRHRVECGLG